MKLDSASMARRGEGVVASLIELPLIAIALLLLSAAFGRWLPFLGFAGFIGVVWLVFWAWKGGARWCRRLVYRASGTPESLVSARMIVEPNWQTIIESIGLIPSPPLGMGPVEQRAFRLMQSQSGRMSRVVSGSFEDRASGPAFRVSLGAGVTADAFHARSVQLADLLRVPSVEIERIQPGVVRVTCIVRDPLAGTRRFEGQSGATGSAPTVTADDFLDDSRD